MDKERTAVKNFSDINRYYGRTSYTEEYMMSFFLYTYTFHNEKN